MEIEQTLQKIGLEGREARVYLAVLKLGQARAHEIADEAKYERTYCYLILEDLIKRGLIYKVEPKKKVATFVAEPPKKLLDDANKRVSEVKKIMPVLSSYLNEDINLPKVRYFEGIEGIRNIYDELFKSKSKNSIGIINPDSAYALLGKSFDRQLKEEIDKGFMISDLVVQGETAKHYMRTKIKLGGPRSKLLPPGVKFETDFLVYDDKLSMISFEPPAYAYLIESAPISNAWRQLHKAFWKLSK